MGVVVQKYGGSSVADADRIRQVADKVARTRASGKDVVVVVSAMGDTTDDLLALARRVSQNPSRRELDMLLSAGERIAMALLAMALNERQVPAVSFTGSQSGIITNDAHANARIVEVRLDLEILGLSTSSFRISVLIDESGVDEAVRALHRELVETIS